MKKFFVTALLCLFVFVSFANPIALPPPSLDELLFDEEGNWELELCWVEGKYIKIVSNSGEVILNKDDFDYIGDFASTVISSKDLVGDFQINPDGDVIEIYTGGFLRDNEIVFRSKDYPLVLRYGSVDDPDVAAPITGQSIALFGGGYALDNLPSIGQRNDIEGAYGIIKGSINIEKTHNTIGLGCSEITNERWEYQNVALIVSDGTYELKVLVTGLGSEIESIYEVCTCGYIDWDREEDAYKDIYSSVEIEPVTFTIAHGETIEGIDLGKRLNVGVNELSIENQFISIYPNPLCAGEPLSYKIDLPVKTLNCQLQICTVEGKVLSLETISASEGTIDIANSSKGDILIVNLLVDGKINYSTKVIVE